MHRVQKGLGLAQIFSGELVVESSRIGRISEGGQSFTYILELATQSLDLGLQGTARVQPNVRCYLCDEAAQLGQTLFVLGQGVLADLFTSKLKNLI